VSCSARWVPVVVVVVVAADSVDGNFAADTAELAAGTAADLGCCHSLGKKEK